MERRPAGRGRDGVLRVLTAASARAAAGTTANRAGRRTARGGASHDDESGTDPPCPSPTSTARASTTASTAPRTRRCCCCPIRWAPTSRCGRRRWPRWSRHFRVLRYDTRGHGRSAVTPGPYTIDASGAMSLALLDALALDARRLLRPVARRHDGDVARRRTRRRAFDRLVLSNTAAQIAPPELWNARIDRGQRAAWRRSSTRCSRAGSRAPFLAASRPRWRRCRRCSSACPARATSPAAPPCATWTSARRSPASRHRRW